jgi:hypothetical protein
MLAYEKLVAGSFQCRVTALPVGQEDQGPQDLRKRRSTMNTTQTALTITVLTAAICATAAQAKPTRDPMINHRQARQGQRIRQGVRSDELTRGEATRLRRGERDIAAAEHAAKSDSHLTPRERLHIQHELNQERRDIYRLKHNDRER